MLERICKKMGVEIEEPWESVDGRKYKISWSGRIFRWNDYYDEWEDWDCIDEDELEITIWEEYK